MSFMRMCVYSTLAALAILLLMVIGWQPFKVWSAKLDGEAKFAEAEYSRRVTVLEAQAKLDSASKLAAAEVARAHGVAESNKIIGNSLKDNDSYLRYLWIQTLDQNGKDQVVYIPTEANLPILEAGRLPASLPTPKTAPVDPHH